MLNLIMLSVTFFIVMLNVILLNVVMLSVVMVNVVAPCSKSFPFIFLIFYFPPFLCIFGVQKKLHTQTLIGRLVQKILQYFSRVLSESFHKHFGKILSAASHTNGSQTINLIQKTYLHRHLKKFRCLCKFGIIVDISGS